MLPIRPWIHLHLRSIGRALSLRSPHLIFTFFSRQARFGSAILVAGVTYSFRLQIADVMSSFPIPLQMYQLPLQLQLQLRYQAPSADRLELIMQGSAGMCAQDSDGGAQDSTPLPPAPQTGTGALACSCEYMLARICNRESTLAMQCRISNCCCSSSSQFEQTKDGLQSITKSKSPLLLDRRHRRTHLCNLSARLSRL